MSNTIINYGEQTNAKDLAEAIKDYVTDDQSVWDMVERSPEPLRCMVYESGIVEDPVALDGTDFYAELVDCLEEIY